jgi:hypothetical protein
LHTAVSRLAFNWGGVLHVRRLCVPHTPTPPLSRRGGYMWGCRLSCCSPRSWVGRTTCCLFCPGHPSFL